MTHLRNVERTSSVPANRVQMAVAQQAGQNAPPHQVTVTVHAVACDCEKQACKSMTHRGENQPWHPCIQVFHAPAEVDYEWYVPLGWAIYADGTHKCPDCRTKAAVEADHKEQARMQADLEKQYGDNCVNCGKTWDEHYHPDLRNPDACPEHVYGRELARPLHKIRQHEHGLKDWSDDLRGSAT